MTLDEKIFAAYLEKFFDEHVLKQKLQFYVFFNICYTLYSLGEQRGEFEPINDSQLKELWDCKLGYNISLSYKLKSTYKELEYIKNRKPDLSWEQIRKYGYLVRLAKCKYFIDFIFVK